MQEIRARYLKDTGILAAPSPGAATRIIDTAPVLSDDMMAQVQWHDNTSLPLLTAEARGASPAGD